MTTHFPYVEIALIENVKEIINSKESGVGNIVLTSQKENFFIYYVNSSTVPVLRYNSLILDNYESKLSSNFSPGRSFLLEISQFKNIYFSNQPIMIELTNLDETVKRSFIVPKNSYTDFLYFIESLIKYGIAVPVSKPSFSFTFYPRAHKDLISFPPTNFSLNANPEETTEELFDHIYKYVEDVFIYLEKKEQIPQDPTFPLGTFASAAGLRKIQASLNDTSNTHPKLTLKEFEAMLDRKGVIKDLEALKDYCYKYGVEDNAVHRVLPFILGIYPEKSSFKKRKKILDKLLAEFRVIRKQNSLVTQEQLENNARVFGPVRVISHDVARTDRDLPAFSTTGGVGLKIIDELLHCFVTFNQTILYLQGMNDIFVPIILSFIPNWDDQSNPIDENGKILDDETLERKMSIIFWCYDALLKKSGHYEFMHDVTKSCCRISSTAMDVITKVSPASALWLRSAGLDGLLFAYSDYVLLYKRTYKDVWAFWMRLLSGPKPSSYIAYFTAAFVLAGLGPLTDLPDTQIATMMEAAPRILSSFPLEELARVAKYLLEIVPPKKDNDEEEQIPSMEGLRFFKPVSF